MNNSPSERNRHSVDKTAYTNALAAWTEASFDLFINFKKIKTCLSQNMTFEECGPLQSSFIGQCPREHMVALFTTMKRELDRLLQELEHLSNVSQADYQQNHPRLIAQTATLNQLNQRAKKKLLLTTLSAT